MKAITYVNKIRKENGCSIDTAEKLTRAMHRERRMSPSYAIRFRPLFGDFDLVNADFMEKGVIYSQPITLDQIEVQASIVK